MALKEPLGQHVTVLQAELMAIDSAACQILAKFPQNGERKAIVFHTDSQKALYELSKFAYTSKAALSATKMLNELAQSHDVSLKWVRAHSGNPGNERADNLAKAAAGEYLTRIDQNDQSELGKELLKAVFHRQTTKAWNKRYLADPRYRQTKLFYPEIDRTKSKALVKLPRYLLSRCVRYISGHCFLRDHMQKLQEWQGETFCRLCEDRVEVETAWHIIAECDAIWRPRENLFGYGRLEPDGSWNPHHLATLLQRPNVAILEDDGLDTTEDHDISNTTNEDNNEEDF